jgi:hypothetical protein
MSVRTIETPDGTVTIEGFAHAIRYHGIGQYGDPYTFACIMTRHGDEAILFAAAGKISAKVRRAMATALREIGIRRVRYERRNAGGQREREITR